MPGRMMDLIGLRQLDNAARADRCHAVRDGRSHVHVVQCQQAGRIQLLPETLEQVQDQCLKRCVQRRDRLLGNRCARPWCAHPPDPCPLALTHKFLPARERCRLADRTIRYRPGCPDTCQRSFRRPFASRGSECRPGHMDSDIARTAEGAPPRPGSKSDYGLGALPPGRFSLRNPCRARASA